MNRARVGTLVAALVRALVWTGKLFAETLPYVWHWMADAASAVRVVLLRRAKRRSPERAAELDARQAGLAERRAARWASWRTVPWRRQMEVRAAASLLLIAAILVLRVYVQSGPDSADRRQSSRTTQVDRPQRPDAVAPRGRPNNVDVASAFWRDVDVARPGVWITDKSAAPVLAPGPLGAWDDFKVGSPVVIDEAGSGLSGRSSRYRLWYRGCHFLGAEYTCGVGHATSKDAVSWERSPQPVFVPPDMYDREHLAAVAVAHGASGYVLWYSVATSWFTGHRHATLKVARSSDGFAWTADSAAVYEAVALAARLVPATAWDGERFHVWLIDSRSSIDPNTGLFPEMPPDGDQMLLHFVSRDGTQLEAAGATPIAPLEMDPATLSIAAAGSEGFRAVFYEQHPLRTEPQGVAVLRSHDGTNWDRARSEAMPLPVRDLGTNVVPVSLTVLPASDGLLAWFVVRRDKGGEAIRVAFRKGGA